MLAWASPLPIRIQHLQHVACGRSNGAPSGTQSHIASLGHLTLQEANSPLEPPTPENPTLDDTSFPIGSLRRSRSIQEFRIDFFLEEEFTVDPDFVRAFLLACGSPLALRSLEHVAHSVSDKHGEVDLVVSLTAEEPDGDTTRAVLLIEDKISAGFQPRQPERYRERGVEGVQKGWWDSFLTVLVAPKTYIPASHGFDAAVSLEQIKEWICRGDSARRAFKVAKIEEAIQKKNATGVQIIDADVTEFRKAYYRCLQAFNLQNGTDFTMRPPAPTYYGDTWFKLKSAALPAQTEIRHMAQAGNISIDFRETDFSKAAPMGALLEDGMALVPTGKHKQHVTIRLPAPPISSFDKFERDQPKVVAALLGAKRLWHLYGRKRAKFDSILESARRPDATIV